MAVTPLGFGAGGTSTGAAVTFNSFNVTASDANTVAIVGVVISVSSNSTATTCAVTYGGVAMTQRSLTLVGSSTNRAAVGIYYLFNPPTGTQSVVVTPGGASTKAQVRAQMAGFSGVDPSGVGVAQTAAATTHAPTSVTGGYDVRVLSNGAALTSPNQTQGYLGGASVGGVGDYMCMQSAAGTGSTISFTCSGTATTPQSVAVALLPPTPKMEELTDPFATKDTVKWTWSGTSDVSGGQMSQPCTSTYNEVDSKSAYDLTGSSFLVQLAQLPTLAESTETSVRLYNDASNYTSFFFNNGKISYYETVAGDSYVANPLTPPASWLRFRCSGTTLYWDTSTDGTTWTNRRSVSTALDLTKLYVKFRCGYYNTVASPGTALWDNVNLPPVAVNTGAFFQFL